MVFDQLTSQELENYITKFGKLNIIDNITIFCQVSKLSGQTLADHQKFFHNKLENVDFVIASL